MAERTMVTLYEDNAGFLAMHRQGDEHYWFGLEQVAGASFAEDAAALYVGDTDDWTVEQRPVEELIDNQNWAPIADYDKRGVVLNPDARPGNAGRAYLGL